MMEPVEIRALHKLRNDIKLNVLVTANMLRRLESLQMITKGDKDFLMKHQDGAVRNPKLVEILKRKRGGFQSLTEVLMFEEKVNKHYVDKLNHLAKEHHTEKKPVRAKEDIETINKMQEKLDICMKLYTGVIPLVLGNERQKVVSRSMVDEVLKQLNRCRHIFDENHASDELSLCELQESFLSTIEAEQREKEETTARDFSTLREENSRLYNKCTWLKKDFEQLKKYQDEIINETVEQQVKARLLRLNLPDVDQPSTTDTLSPGRHIDSFRTSCDPFSPRVLHQTFNIHTVDSFSIRHKDEHFSMNMKGDNMDIDDESS